MPLLWETKDIVAETRVGTHFASQWDVLYYKPRTTVDGTELFDAAFFAGKLVPEHLIAIGEIKARKIRAGQFPTIMLSADKVRRVCQIGHSLNTSVIFGIETQRNDPAQYWWANLYEAEHMEPIWGGRTADPRIATDIEYCVYIPWKLFHPSTERPWESP